MDVSMTSASEQLGELVEEARESHQPVILTDQGKPVGAIVSAEDLRYFQQLEDAADIALAEQAKRESRGTYTWDEVEAMLDADEAADQ